MKLQHLHESYSEIALLRKTCKQLDITEPNIWQLTDPEDTDYHDAWQDVTIALQIMRQDVEARADSYNDVETVLNLRINEEELRGPLQSLTNLKDGPLGKLPQVAPTMEAVSALVAHVGHLKASALHIKEVMRAVRDIKRLARNTNFEPSSDMSFKVSIARAVLKRLNITYEA